MLAPDSVSVTEWTAEVDVGRLISTAAAVDGEPPLDEQARRVLAAGGGSGFTAVVARDGGLAGYAQVVGGADGDVAFVVDPAHRDPEATVARSLAAAVAGAGPARMVVSTARPEHDRFATDLGLGRQRALYQMRRPLPLPDDLARAGAGLATRPFVPGDDDEAWLAVNNRAFAGHPDQGGWDVTTLAGRKQEAWFDPQGFLIHEIDGAIAGFCWTKVHADADPPLGEIYVIGVDPAVGGRGLGRRLVLAGLDHLAGVRVPGAGPIVGMLYTDADNTGAVKLYVDLGFEVHHVDTVYGRVPVTARVARD